MQQLIFDLFPPAPPSFDNFAVGRNEEALAAIHAFIESHLTGNAVNTGLVLWGPPGAGKTHLLTSACVHATVAGLPTQWIGRENARPPMPDADTPRALWLVDDVDAANDDLQGILFTLYNTLKENGGGLLISASLPPARLPLREDLRTRLGWGGIYEIVSLRDEDRLQTLITHADHRGARLPEDVAGYLLKHSRRDMRSLLAVLDALDRYSLSLKRPLTLPLVREWLQQHAPNPPV